jgi:succinate dehydrogenase/fumarate reductase flavoprotein subunit
MVFLAEQVGVRTQVEKKAEVLDGGRRRKDANMKRLRAEKQRLKKEFRAAKRNPETLPEELKRMLALRNKLVRLHNRMRKLEGL